MATLQTPTSGAAFAKDTYAFSAVDVIPDAACLQHSTVAGSIEGDRPLLHVGFCRDDTATITAEADDIDPSNPELASVAIASSKISTIVRVSREQWVQDGAADQLSKSVGRALIRRADELFFTEAAPTPPAIAPAAGLLNVEGIVDGGQIGDNLDALIDLLSELQANKSQPSAIVVDSYAWGELRKRKVAESWHQTLLGAGTSDAEQRLIGLPLSVNPALPAFTGVVVDKSAIASAIGQVMVSTSEHAFFGSDEIALRALVRLGSTVVRPERCGKFTVAPSGS